MKKYHAEILTSIPSFSWLLFFVLIPSTLILTFAFRTIDPSEGITTATVIVFILILGSYVVADLVAGTDGQMIGNKNRPTKLRRPQDPIALSVSRPAELIRACTNLLSIKSANLAQLAPRTLDANIP